MYPTAASPAAWGRSRRATVTPGGLLVLIGTAGRTLTQHQQSAVAELAERWPLLLAGAEPAGRTVVHRQIRPEAMTRQAIMAALAGCEFLPPVRAVLAPESRLCAVGTRLAGELGLPGYGMAAADVVAHPIRTFDRLGNAGLPIAPGEPAELVAWCVTAPPHHTVVAAVTRFLPRPGLRADELVDVEDPALADPAVHRLAAEAMSAIGVQSGITRLHLGRSHAITGASPGLGDDLGRTVRLATGLDLVREAAWLAYGVRGPRELISTRCTTARRAWVPAPDRPESRDRLRGMAWVDSVIWHDGEAEVIVVGGDAEQCERWIDHARHVLAESEPW